jgi:hypothetical protein
MSRKQALPLASSTFSSLVINILVMMYLTSMQEQTSLITAAMVCCGCSTFSAALRFVQQMLYGLVGIKTY